MFSRGLAKTLAARESAEATAFVDHVAAQMRVLGDTASEAEMYLRLASEFADRRGRYRRFLMDAIEASSRVRVRSLRRVSRASVQHLLDTWDEDFTYRRWRWADDYADQLQQTWTQSADTWGDMSREEMAKADALASRVWSLASARVLEHDGCDIDEMERRRAERPGGTETS